MPPPLTLAEVPSYMWMIWAFDAVGVVFAFAFGTCLGSLTNALVYRLPRGIGVVTPPSACPSCGTTLTWRENIPVFGWLLLGGRCRFCKCKISPEYPIVEAAVGMLFVLLYLLWYVIPVHAGFGDAVWLGIDWAGLAPDWARGGLRSTWPPFVMVLLLVASLVAMTLVDAKTFSIPLVLAWFPTLVGVLTHAGFSVYVQQTVGRLPHASPGWTWVIPTPGPHGWGWIGAAVGGVAGVILANVLLAAGVFRRSFADYDTWEREALVKAGVADPDQFDPQSEEQAHLWVQYPHARREMLKEIAFLAPVVALALLGKFLAERWAGPWALDSTTFAYVPAANAPLWLQAVSGCLLGYLVGGGVVWAIRILGTLGVGKEAMGLGDVHLLAAVGACIGWLDAGLAFLASAFVGLAWVILGKVLSGKLTRVMPYGPYLAIATLLVVLCKPLVEMGLSRLLPAFAPVNLP